MHDDLILNLCNLLIFLCYKMGWPRRLSENRKPTAEKRILAHVSRMYLIRSIQQVFASFNRETMDSKPLSLAMASNLGQPSRIQQAC
jgi:hypothetical protein